MKSLAANDLFKNEKLMKLLSHGVLYIALFFLSFFMLFPFFWMLSASFKPDWEIFQFPIRWIPETFRPENFVRMWTTINYGRLLFNTLFLMVVITALQILTCTLAGYAFAKIKFKGSRAVFLCYLSTLMVPFQVVMIPQFTIIRSLSLTDSHAAIILLLAFSPFGVFLMRQFFLGIPYELSEAARIDGLGDFGIYRRIILPLSKPAIAALAIFTSVNVWNEFLLPLIYIQSRDRFTIQQGLRSLFLEHSVDFSGIMAGAVVTVIPVLIVFLFLQRFFVEGVVMSGIKG